MSANLPAAMAPFGRRATETYHRNASLSDADVKCWAFCPPGGLVSANLSAAMAPFCTSVIVGKDAISRVSMTNLAAMYAMPCRWAASAATGLFLLTS